MGKNPSGARREGNYYYGAGDENVYPIRLAAGL